MSEPHALRSDAWIARLFENTDMLKMEHLQRLEDLNLGYGFLYAALIRIIRAKKAVVIGSLRGFVPLVLARALSENVEGGEVLFIDPSMADDFWKDEAATRAHFASFGVSNIRHFLMTTQEFVETPEYKTLTDVSLVFVDGYHSKEQARFDYEAFKDRLAPHGMTLFHDSTRRKISRIYGEEHRYEHRVVDLMDDFRADPSLQVFSLPLGAGITLVQKRDQTGGAKSPTRRGWLSSFF